MREVPPSNETLQVPIIRQSFKVQESDQCPEGSSVLLTDEHRRGRRSRRIFFQLILVLIYLSFLSKSDVRALLL